MAEVQQYSLGSKFSKPFKTSVFFLQKSQDFYKLPVWIA